MTSRRKLRHQSKRDRTPEEWAADILAIRDPPAAM